MSNASRRLLVPTLLVALGCGGEVSLGTKRTPSAGPEAGQGAGGTDEQPGPGSGGQGGQDGSAGGTSGTSTSGTSTSGTNTGGASTGGTSTGGTRPIASADFPAPCVADPLKESAAQVCTPVTHSTRPLATDTLVLVERSRSMLESLPEGTLSRWDGVKAGLERFAADYTPDASVRLALQLFGHGSVADCEPKTYASPLVDFDAAGNEAAAIEAAFELTRPAGEAPTLAALQAALDYMGAHQQQTPDRYGRVVLVTDGLPGGCSEDDSIEALAQAAARAAYPTQPDIATYVVQLGTSVDLNPVAVAGKTKAVYLIPDGDVADDLYNALYHISYSSLMPCVYALTNVPSGPLMDPSLTSVIVHDDTGKRRVPYVGSSAGCAESPFGGWHYDDANDTHAIELCPCTCASVFRASTVELLFHCPPL